MASKEVRESLAQHQREAAGQIETAARSLRTEHNPYNARALRDQIVAAADRAMDAALIAADEMSS